MTTGGTPRRAIYSTTPQQLEQELRETLNRLQRLAQSIGRHHPQLEDTIAEATTRLALHRQNLRQ